jgi:hypothetical protein
LKKTWTEAAKLIYGKQEDISKCKGDFWDHQEDIFHVLGLKHKLYFAGKLNGNSCRNTAMIKLLE